MEVGDSLRSSDGCVLTRVTLRSAWSLWCDRRVRLGPIVARKCFMADVVCSHHENVVTSESRVCCLKRAGRELADPLRPDFPLSILKEK